ncbi:ligand-binding sensor domain-containing diguanylate cyclase [Oleiagrimonas sp. MCCC 1A03011]|uniref:ligand-binding sensor domain-containing diguanylate cyclase n=1 Tax=Oleiagrimonas sp. MCCC 1A03011 TaxID=1926883 RepID=UPI000DC3E54F|nr:ligand-binding sensor domain-containing diguanylate cyclase [Oleiagrimonas sp. MCCC 1A03011]RAP57797.1 GGDEF domain-containing protein [Oleiagrimonas sp. MCCC 1A03011]
MRTFLLLALTGWLLLCRAGMAMAAPAASWSAFDTPWFTHIGIDEGLPHSVTTAVAQDRNGLIWIGTMGGLVRYDGYRMQRFDTDGKKASALPDSYVRSLLALPDGRILVGTNAGGLAVFDPATNAFHTYPIGPNGTSDAKIYDLSQGRDGIVWIATDRGVDRLDTHTDTIRHVPLGKRLAPRNFSVFEDRAGNLWVGNDRGLFERMAGTRKFVRPSANDDAVSTTVLDDQIWSITEDREGRIWAGSGQSGAVYRDRSGRWHPVPDFSGYDAGARRPTVRAMLETDDGTMWIGTDGAGIVAYRVGAATSQHIDHDPARASSLPGNTVRGLLEDATGNRWVATDLGVARSNGHARTAFAVLSSPLQPRALADPNVHGIYVDNQNRVWLGLGMGKIDLIPADREHLRHLHLGGSQAHRDVQAFAEGPDGSIWVGSQGMARIDPKTFAVHDSVLPELDNKPVLTLLRAGRYLLIGTYEGVYRYDFRNGRLTHFMHQPNDPHSLASDTVRQIVQVGDEIWYATTRGISIAKSAGADTGFRSLRHHDGDAESLPQNYVGGIARDARGRIWVSTFGGLAVIDHYRPNAPVHFRVINQAQGLASDKINAVLIDDDGAAWVSMSNGLAKIDPDTGHARNLGIRDGLHIASYIYIAAAKADGRLLFGGLGGLSVVRPRVQSDDGAKGRLSITAATLNGHDVPPAELPHSGQTLTVDRSGRSLRAEFALLDYHAPRETAYSYRMQGFDETWTHTPKGTPPAAIYTNLPHGRYTLQLRARTHGMYPHVVTTSFPVVVRPLWYETLPFRLAIAVLALLLIFVLVHLRTLYLRRQAQRLQQQVDERTRDLQAANLRLDQLAGTDELSGLYNRRRFLELAEEVRAKAESGHACMVLLDLDRFKQVNDTYGHLAGDAAIRAVASVIRTHCRETDLAARFGGEELVICLPDSSLEQSMQMAERIRETLAQTSIHHQRSRITVTVSIGVAALREGESLQQWISRADAALYAAKDSGRNRCKAAS